MFSWHMWRSLGLTVVFSIGALGGISMGEEAPTFVVKKAVKPPESDALTVAAPENIDGGTRFFRLADVNAVREDVGRTMELIELSLAMPNFNPSESFPSWNVTRAGDELILTLHNYFINNDEKSGKAQQQARSTTYTMRISAVNAAPLNVIRHLASVECLEGRGDCVKVRQHLTDWCNIGNDACLQNEKRDRVWYEKSLVISFKTPASSARFSWALNYLSNLEVAIGRN